ncbi:MAG: DNA polymerase III subunit [Candidatus Omnitrophica bacterium]|nr:DNA polymerase III subunit [Candidatus Omnitrophota bacterium]MDD5487644.1 DNA polymerase III subunit [Candidatus Omnitrophota bacterium]
MLSFADIKGQTNAIKYLTRCLAAGRVSSSYLFTGPDGVGRSSCARAFIRAIMCPGKPEEARACDVCPTCRRVEALEHPDVLWIKPEKGKAIKIEEVRQAREKLNLKPFEAVSSVCVIEDAHLLTVSAANALLKILEEPPGGSMLILITDKKELLPRTVVSRCSEVRFFSLPIPVAKEVISSKLDGTGESELSFLAGFSQGSPGKALEIARTGVVARREDVMRLLKDIAAGENVWCMNWDVEDKLQMAEDIELVLMLVRDTALVVSGAESRMTDTALSAGELMSMFGKSSPDKLYALMARLVNVRRALMGNANPKIAAQVLPGMVKG